MVIGQTAMALTIGKYPEARLKSSQSRSLVTLTAKDFQRGTYRPASANTSKPAIRVTPCASIFMTRVPGPTWRVADAQALDLDDDVFDLVVCQFGVMFFPNRIGAYREVRRVLEPHGSFLFNVWDTLDTSELPAAVYAALAEVLPDNPPDFGARIPHGYADPTRIRADVQAGGLTVEELDRIELSGKSPSAAQLAEGFCLGTPLRFQLQERGDLADIVPKVAEVTTRMVGEGPVEGSMAAYVVRARTAL